MRGKERLIGPHRPKSGWGGKGVGLARCGPPQRSAAAERGARAPPRSAPPRLSPARPEACARAARGGRGRARGAMANAKARVSRDQNDRHIKVRAPRGRGVWVGGWG